MKTVLIVNPKGGSGKTTLSVNIAGYLASRGQQVALMDMDRQQSSALWLTMRSGNLPHISLFDSRKKHHQPVDWLVIDSPAGLHGKNLTHALKLVSKIIVPVAPSLFDLQASCDFLKTLSQEKMSRNSKCHIGVVGMRMEMRTKAAWALEHFLSTLDLPILAYLRETQVYVNAAFEGKSLFDLPHHLAARELEQWTYLQGWLEKD